MQQTEVYYSSASSAPLSRSRPRPLRGGELRGQLGSVRLLQLGRDLLGSRAIALTALLLRVHWGIIRVHFVCPHDAIALPFR
jgi:hypothetical protein